LALGLDRQTGEDVGDQGARAKRSVPLDRGPGLRQRHHHGLAWGAGLFLLHSVFIGADVRGRLLLDVADLTDAVHAAFLAVTDTVDDGSPTDPLRVLRGDQDGP
jgi:hypothetical protein